MSSHFGLSLLIQMLRTPLRNVYGNPLKPGDEEMSLSPEEDLEEEASPCHSTSPVFTLSSEIRDLPSTATDSVQFQAEIELLTYELDSQKTRVLSLEKEVAEKEKSLAALTANLNEKRVEIAKLKQKGLEMGQKLSEGEARLEGVQESNRVEMAALRAKLDQSERNRSAQLAFCRGKMKEMKDKYKGKIEELQRLLTERHSRYKEKENTFLQEKSRISSQLEQFQSKVMHFCESKASTARTDFFDSPRKDISRE